VKILGYELPERAIRAAEQRMSRGSFEAFDMRRVLMEDFRRHADRPSDPYRVADAAATRLIQKYAGDGKIEKVPGTRRWLRTAAQTPEAASHANRESK
jgi:hypothetical protein